MTESVTGVGSPLPPRSCRTPSLPVPAATRVETRSPRWRPCRAPSLPVPASTRVATTVPRCRRTRTSARWWSPRRRRRRRRRQPRCLDSTTRCRRATDAFRTAARRSWVPENTAGTRRGRAAAGGDADPPGPATRRPGSRASSTPPTTWEVLRTSTVTLRLGWKLWEIRMSTVDDYSAPRQVVWETPPMLMTTVRVSTTSAVALGSWEVLSGRRRAGGRREGRAAACGRRSTERRRRV